MGTCGQDAVGSFPAMPSLRGRFWGQALLLTPAAKDKAFLSL